MAQKFIIHAGNLKTGSSTIQNVLQSNLAQVEAECDLAVPALELSPSVHAALCEKNKPHARESEFNWSNLQTWLDKKPQSSVLFTSEVFIRVDPNEFKDQLMAFAPERVDVYVYLRPHIQMITSNLSQAYKTGFCRFGLVEAARRMSKTQQVNFVPVMQNFFSAFGPDHVHCRDFSRSLFPNGDVVQDFGDFIGKPRLSEIAAANGPTERNVSPLTEELAILHWVRTLVPKSFTPQKVARARKALFGPLKRELAKAIPPELMTRFVLPVDVQNAAKERFEAGRVAFSQSLDGFRASEEWLNETVKTPELPRNIPVAAVEVALAGVLTKLKAGSGPMRELVQKAKASLPFTLDGGEKVVPIADLPMFK